MKLDKNSFDIKRKSLYIENARTMKLTRRKDVESPSIEVENQI